ncbi:MAG: DNA polymerase III subunit beta [Candidatus Omnitrophica bacterium]|nr:DNA polymerase III subunit beta [Candidatus Omnitrophota bacterium]
MKIVTEKNSLLKSIQTLQTAISSKTTLPILSNFLIETQKGKVHMAATDLDVGISLSIPVDIIEEGGITIPAKRFVDIIRDLPDGKIDINVRKNNAISIESQKCFFKLMGLPKEEFPKLPKLQDKESFATEQQLLKNMLNLTAFAVSHDETKYILNGVLFAVKGKKIRLVATDGRRLALIEKDLTQNTDLKREVIVPIKAIQELMRNLGDEGTVKVVFSENQISFQFDNIMLISRLIEGQFPNYEQVIPKEGKDKIVVDRETFLWAAKRVSNLTSPDSQSIKIDLFKDKLIFSKNSPDMGEAKEEIDIEHKGDEFSVGFNPDYLIDALKSLKDQSVSLELTGPESPGIIRAQDNYVYIVLPMQLT